MSCLYDIYEAFKDIFIDCIFCTEERVEKVGGRKKRFKTKSTQTYISLSSSSEKDEKELIEPGS